ncbi:MAG: RseA family anti-sigma factor [Rhodoferax sp.]|uniref:sigma-E factor negative regulatory protein n=1 Tax=Rhodoferax sp. TaxID=50421 RepID=UPI002620E8EE|nr:RseA family anti-sigma factor [Rhodoferax sp.]MDD5333097.1 RseA family anti-sigma factor [Rhodoferax sp.]
MQETDRNRELVSALADGQLRGEEFVSTVEWLGQDEEARLSWQAYHLVGDVLRSGETMASARDAAFLRGLKHRLRYELPLAPNLEAANGVAAYPLSADAAALKRAEHRVANDASSRWKLLAGVASLVAVAVIGWQVAGGFDDRRGTPQLAQVPMQSGQPEVALPQTLTAQGEPAQVMLRDPQLDALLAAHRQSAGTSALQMSAGFLRNATFEGASR